jgi:3-isopropylmalate/(R)-2-methylmalate dehydratase large subunit
MGMTAVEKILARHAARETVRPGELVWVDVDVAMIQDSGGPRRIEDNLRRLGAGLWNPERLIVVNDHYWPATDAISAEILQTTREWAKRYGVEHFYDGQGISHTLMIERGHVAPGMLLIGGDSHTPTAGAVGAFAAGVGSTEMLGVVITGQIWLRVPETLRVEWSGRLPPGTVAKDMVLRVIGDIGADGANYQAVQWAGDAVFALPLGERSVLTNMAAEMGAKTGFLEPDRRVFEHLARLGVTNYEPTYSDPDARYVRVLDYDASQLEPQVALPPRVDDAHAVSEVQGLRVDQAYIGACTGAKYEDLAMAAEVLRGRTVAPHVRLLVAPASMHALQQAASENILSDLVAAGATILGTGCQACAGLGAGILAPGERCIASINRNFRGRMGSREAEVFLGSPYTVAASAVAGEITDPRPMLEARA